MTTKTMRAWRSNTKGLAGLELGEAPCPEPKDGELLVNVTGGGLTGQADAIKQGAARALCELSPDNRKPLKTEGHLSRDPRAKERRKYGLKKARKAPQFSKR